jgi:DNA ligase-1
MNVYNGFDLTGCTASEKYDGVCVVWTGVELLTRDGKEIEPPDWWTVGLPPVRLSGELWAGRGRFEVVLSVYRSGPLDPRWPQLKLMVFSGEWALRKIVGLGDHAEFVRRWPCLDADRERDEIIAAGGEGIVIRDVNGCDWKHKRIDDDDAVVIGHYVGTGRKADRLGALLVRDRAGRTFKIGSGLNDDVRNDPPPAGAVVQFEYQGRTIKGVPRFASFLRVRAEASLEMADFAYVAPPQLELFSI